MESKVAHLLYCPFTGLGLYNGFRGNHWLKNRIQIFKQFVVPSLLAQTDKNFYLWVSWRYEERINELVKDFETYLKPLLKTIFTYSGVCFWDDKYPDEIAHDRLVDAVHGAIGAVLNAIGDVEEIYMTIQPSDDCYDFETVETIKLLFKQNPSYRALGFTKGYVMDYVNWKIAEWNPTTNPPFFTIRFDRKIFQDPRKHVEYTGPYKSHEYVGDFLKYLKVEERGFLVGTHSSNISTVFNHPYTGNAVPLKVLTDFGLENATVLKVPFSLMSKIFQRMPYSIKRKLRFWGSEKNWIFRPLFAILYNILRT